MKRLLLLILLLSTTISYGQNSLWKKAAKAEKDGKPQTAVSYYTQLEEKNAGDSLELYYIATKKFNNLNKYNWKEANRYTSSTMYPLHKALYDNLALSIQKYKDHPRVVMLVYDKLLQDKSNIDSRMNRSGADYMNLREECAKAIKQYPDESYRRLIQQIIASMDSRDLYSSSKGQMAPSASVPFNVNARNISDITVEIYRLNDNVIFDRGYSMDRDCSSAIKNNGVLVGTSHFDKLKNEYNITESVEVPVDLSREGVYVICFSGGGQKVYESVNVSPIAAAVRENGSRSEVYAADMTTGKPYEDITVSHFPSDIKFNVYGFHTMKSDVSIPLKQDGFTTLPFWLSSDETIRVEHNGELSSPLLGKPYGYYYSRHSSYMDYSVENMVAFTDRTLYRPSDTIRFKVICYSTKGFEGEVIPNKELTLAIRHQSDGKELAKVTVVTNSFGSASGAFTLPEGSKNGIYIIDCTSDYGYRLTSVRVEEYIRPNFVLSTDKNEEVYSFGDIIKQSGTLKSYAGFPVKGAKVEYRIWSYYTKSISGTTVTDDNGRYEITFASETPKTKEKERTIYSYNISIKVTDPQGETHESSAVIPVSDVPVDIEFNLPSHYFGRNQRVVLKDSVDRFTVNVKNLSGIPQKFEGTYSLLREGKEVCRGEFDAGKEIPFDFNKLDSGLYKMMAEINYRGRAIKDSIEFYLMGTRDGKLPFEQMCYYHPLVTEDAIRFLLGTSEDDLYLEMELFSSDGRVYRKNLHLQKEMRVIELPFEESYGTSVKLTLFGFREGRMINEGSQYLRPVRHRMDVEISSFRDKTGPSSKETITIKAAPGSELVVSIYDVTTDRYRKNNYRFSPLPSIIYAQSPEIETTLGGPHLYRIREMVRSKAAGAANVMYESAEMMDSAVEEEGAPADDAEQEQEEVSVRSNLSKLISFQPHIEVPENGEALVSFQTGDLLSTFRILVMGHNKKLDCGTASENFIVQKDLMVMPSLPLFAREGDVLYLKSKVVNLSNAELRGTGHIELFNADTKEKITMKELKDIKLNILANGQSELMWKLNVPSGIKNLGVKISYKAGGKSDGEQHIIAVEPKGIVLTEAASFIIGSGHNHKYYEKQLREKFQAANPKIEYAEYSTMDAVKEALSGDPTPVHDNMVEWLNTFYITRMKAKIDGEPEPEDGTFARLAAFQTYEGGFRWFNSMDNSITLTLLFLERMAQLRDFNAAEITADREAVIKKALAYVDSHADAKTATSLQTCYIRSLWISVPMGERAEKGFRRQLSESEDNWQDLPILQKARLILTLQNCKETKYWNSSFAKRIKTLTESLKDYAVENPTVGVYFPNAVMPWRGLMNSEIYAHARLIDVFSRVGEKKTVDGLAQWLLLQKHNQAWENNVATADAVHALISSGAKDLKFGAVYYTYETTLDKTKESANEIEISRTFRRQDGSAVSDGDMLHAGELIRVSYYIHNSENRSFVEMKAMRPACFYPKDERSMYCWGGYYREVKPSQTNYFFELLPEENTYIEETYYVSQSGVFTAGISQIECLYAHEYRGHTASLTVSAE